MRLFKCDACDQLLYFENTHCESCQRRLGFDARALRFLAFPRPQGEAEPARFCANAQQAGCNWLVDDDDGEPFCLACRHNRTIPNLSNPGNPSRWRKLESAKRRLFYSLLRFRLPLTRRPADPQGLAFDFIEDDQPGLSVMTGHDNGLITINIAEAEDAERERRRHNMGEQYRTLIGHMRHEAGHYYWTTQVERSADWRTLEGFRALFGDERADYGASLARHYAQGAPWAWSETYISAYASAHPWEDWAETFAHYLHMVDTLDTAHAFGVRLDGGRDQRISTEIDFDPYRASLEALIEAWLPLTFAVNSINRSMGQPDLYPFVPSPTVLAKLAFVHARLREPTGGAESADEGALKAMAAGLRGGPPTPNA